MTEIIFSFDSEDFTSNAAADAILAEAEILREEGVRGGFCIVGLLAKQLVAWGRTDIAEALKHHDILTHSYGHTFHPTINEYTDTEDFDEAYEEVIRQEQEGVRLIHAFTGRQPILGACPPGNQKSYAAMYAYADMGLPLYADTYCDVPEGGGMYYCNIYHAQYTYTLEALFGADDDKLRGVLDEMADKKRVVFFTHPNAAVFTEFWDTVNYYKENLCPFGEWKECRRRDPEETAAFYETIRRLIQLIKADPRFRITSYSEVLETLAAEPRRVIRRTDIPQIRTAIRETFAPLREPCSLSLADVFLGAKEMLLGRDEHLCGKVYGLLDTPYAIETEVTVTADEIRASAEEMHTERFLPEVITVGGKRLGPGDWLRAALDVLCGAERVVLTPSVQMPSLDGMPNLREPDMMGWMQSDVFEDRYLSKRLKLQAWTMRFLA